LACCRADVAHIPIIERGHTRGKFFFPECVKVGLKEFAADRDGIHYQNLALV